MQFNFISRAWLLEILSTLSFKEEAHQSGTVCGKGVERGGGGRLEMSVDPQQLSSSGSSRDQPFPFFIAVPPLLPFPLHP